ncbi:TRAP transporter large permease [Falsirhodobacter halotolerans]|uniref:TRAP transporter large permease n=1 Tax=Falsirhodobacter halotolerans TaxID=1146892 RepID=UPI001FD244D2|nr:TRAP transporter large permease subunit [Falsirhodobacter halotolerans]MCJ8138275.1 TRAP transporter large permease subunit [Falsirhodobacter halotolerans]
MDPVFTSMIALGAAMIVLLISGVWIAIALLSVGILTFLLFTHADPALLVPSTLWDASWNWALTALPLFIWMGEILSRSGLSANLFGGLAPWLRRWPGGLMHVNVVGCGIMAAVAGSSAVTTATVGRMSIPELTRRGYDRDMMIGSLAGAGTFGLLIPPSIIMIVYGVLAQQSVARLFIAGILPGLCLVVLFSSYIALWARFNRSKAPVPEPAMSFREKLSASRELTPVLLLIVAVIASIYGGLATATEAATIGILGALGLAALNRSLDRRMFLDSLMAATRLSCMIALVISAASVLSVAVGFADIPRTLAGWVEGIELSRLGLILALTIFFLILGCFLEGVSILVLSSAVVLPMVDAAGIDLLWFGIYIVIVIECAQITPPLGFNLIVLKSMTGRSIWEITRATLPFLILLLVMIALIVAFPQIVTALPQMMSN